MRERHRISKMQGGLLFGVAISGEIAQVFIGLVPLIGGWITPIISVLMWITFWVWFRMLHVDLIGSPERFMGKFYLTILEMIPYVGMIVPGWTAMVWLTIRITRKQDREYNQQLYEEEARQQQRPRRAPRGANDNAPRRRRREFSQAA